MLAPPVVEHVVVDATAGIGQQLDVIFSAVDDIFPSLP
jgi:hypothetical protein